MNITNIKSKLERLVEQTGYIISNTAVTNELKSYLNQIKDDWESLNGKIDCWKDIQLSSNMIESTEWGERFTVECKTNMQTIKSICEDTLTKINVEHEKEQNETDNNVTKYPKENSHFDWAKLGVISAIIIGLGAWYGEVRYDQGKEAIRRDYDKSEKKLEYIKDSIAEENLKLLDSLENYKIKNSDLEKTICKIKRTCK